MVNVHSTTLDIGGVFGFKTKLSSINKTDQVLVLVVSVVQSIT